jgi:BMFP domain-containing protein YqiC
MAKNTNQTVKILTKLSAEHPTAEKKEVEKKLKKEFQEWLKRFQSVSQASTKKVC